MVRVYGITPVPSAMGKYSVTVEDSATWEAFCPRGTRRASISSHWVLNSYPAWADTVPAGR